MKFFRFLTKQGENEEIELYIYLKSITEETGDLKRLIRCYEYSQLMQMPAQASANPNMSGISMTKLVDKYTPALNLAAAINLIIPNAVLYFYCTKSKRIHYMITLNDVFISSTKQYLERKRNTLCDTFTLEFNKIKWEYNSTSTGWDLTRKKPF